MDLELEVPEGEALSLVSTPTRIGNTTCRPHNRRQPGSEKKSRVRARLEPGKMRVGYPHEGGVAQSSLSETPTHISKPPRREDRRDGRRKGRREGRREGWRVEWRSRAHPRRRLPARACRAGLAVGEAEGA